MKRWFDNERITALANAGRLHEGRAAEKRQMVDRWNRGVDTSGMSNMEFVTLTSGGVEAAVACRPLTLPWPPSGNTAVRHATKNGKTIHYLRPEVEAYRASVALIVRHDERIGGCYNLHLEMSPPDARRRDIDNALKSSLDALVQAKYLPDDSMAYMRELHVIVNDDRRGDIRVVAEPIEREAA